MKIVLPEHPFPEVIVQCQCRGQALELIWKIKMGMVKPMSMRLKKATDQNRARLSHDLTKHWPSLEGMILDIVTVTSHLLA
jgi:hypothetical protein